MVIAVNPNTTQRYEERRYGDQGLGPSLAVPSAHFPTRVGGFLSGSQLPGWAGRIRVGTAQNVSNIDITFTVGVVARSSAFQPNESGYNGGYNIEIQ